ncbi:hypothetical protein B4144_2033 [Bacillus atrophaeus]|nr:hypothetical protein B4144_2033 [Bacillus atrophaeus]
MAPKTVSLSSLKSVTQIQKALAALYFYPDKSAKNFGIDGYCGAKTANAVKWFQSMYGLADDGVYGPKMKVKLESLLKYFPGRRLFKVVRYSSCKKK